MRDRNTVLVVDDDPDVRATLVDILEAEGFIAHQASTASEAVAQVERLHPDVLLLDLGLGSGNGFDVLRSLGNDPDMGIIVVSGHGAEADRVAGLELGADDFVAKPFMRRELVARVRAIIRRSAARPQPQVPEQLQFGRLAIDTAAKEACLDGRSIGLTAKEFELLHFLAASPRRVFSRDQILDQVWGSASWRAPGTVSEHVRRVRQKLAVDGSHHDWITTLKGAGYRFEPVPAAVVPVPGPARQSTALDQA
ncbi:response regulator transcription factor [Aquihabitans sp. McL0605]|uniref:response regulator transcription factor n=1 Tax=Aquihabitans sp. McL0605 TaxID=3415671 RepID=UPI003CED5BF4